MVIWWVFLGTHHPISSALYPIDPNSDMKYFQRTLKYKTPRYHIVRDVWRVSSWGMGDLIGPPPRCREAQVSRSVSTRIFHIWGEIIFLLSFFFFFNLKLRGRSFGFFFYILKWPAASWGVFRHPQSSICSRMHPLQRCFSVISQFLNLERGGFETEVSCLIPNKLENC